MNDSYDDFNPRSHEGSDSILRVDFFLHLQFQSTLPRRERPSAPYVNGAPAKISIHAPTKGATVEVHFSTQETGDFNPRSHEGSDESLGYILTESGISIHAPTKGATNQCGNPSEIQKISIHAPTKGATGYPYKFCKRKRNFNPRSHEGSDHHFSNLVSHNTNFNPRSHEGSDSNFIQFYILYFSISINLYQYFPSYFLSLPSPYNFCTFILVRVLLYYRVYLPFAQQSYNKNIIC